MNRYCFARLRRYPLLCAFLLLCFAMASCSGKKQNQLSGLSDGWWTESSFYHIWVKGFCDSDGDGCGDINGIRSKLGYIHDEVGCDALWLSPFFDCAGKGTEADYNMHGYDVTDYYAVNPLFGTEADVLALVAECHALGMKIIFDFVPNHTSSEHPWFKDAVAGRNGKRDWYVWSDTGTGQNPMGSSPAWHYSEEAGAWYYAPFWEGMPDLNYKNPEVSSEMRNAAFYWLDRGFDGMRVDAARYLVEDGSRTADSESTHEWFTDLHARMAKRYRSPKVLMGEVWVERRRDVLEQYFGTADSREFDMVTDFDSGRAQLRSVLVGASALPDAPYENPHGIPTAAFAAFLCNHDEFENRLGTVFGSDVRRISQALVLSALRPPVPVIYYGQEIGMEDMPLYGDIRHRGPFDWNLAERVASSDYPVTRILHDALSLRREYARTITGGTVEELNPNRGQCAAYVMHPQDPSEPDLLCVLNFAAYQFDEYIFYKKAGSASSWSGASQVFGTPGAEHCPLILDGDRVIAGSIPAAAVAVYELR